MTVFEAAAALRAKSISCRELTQQALAAAERENPRINAFITLTRESALARAAELDAELARGVDRGPLHGIPLAHKDCLFTKGVRTTWGSPLFADFVPDRDAAVVTRLDRAGAVSIGKTNLHELTYGMTSNNPHFGPVRNPRDVDRSPGGSSGGSGAAIAAGIVRLATGTDTGGSIRIPASFCGVAGFKPTFDRISREGCMPLGFTLDHIGPMAATIREAAVMFAAMSGATLRTATTLRTVRLGIPGNYFFDRVDPQISAAVHRAALLAERAGARVSEVSLPDAGALNAAGRIVQLAEAAAVLARYAHRRDDFGADVLALLDQGRLIPATDYLNAQRIRSMIAREFAEVWQDFDCLIAPATPMPAPKIGAATVTIAGEVEEVRAAGTRLTRPINVLGWPAAALPCGSTPEGLPLGLQLLARPGADESLLAWAAVLEDALG